ncbi:unnamed protein product [Allacma fusca]|uniref:Uncharacterized protein n=1 Tax=Allacma fusca TaxID=39272 RepID=A0A8J2KVY7_9HEXA|nr:unnamed protein product [Allacma fusca]
MTVELVTRSTLNIEPALFPFGVLPGSIVEILGATSAEKSHLITYLMAKFLTSYPDKRAVYIDTRQSFSLENFVSILSQLVPNLKNIKKQTMEEWKYHPGLVPFLERITTLSCYTAEDLLFCFGPKNAGQLERMLMVAPDYAVVFVDTLDNFSYCPSLKSVSSSDYPDFVLLLKRSVELTKTPVICVMNNNLRPVKQEEISSSYSNEESRDQAPVFSNVTFGKVYFTHSLFLQRLEECKKGFEGGGNSKAGPKCMLKAHLRSRNNPKMALSAANHWVKFSILSGILNFEQDTD